MTSQVYIFARAEGLEASSVFGVGGDTPDMDTDPTPKGPDPSPRIPKGKLVLRLAWSKVPVDDPGEPWVSTKSSQVLDIT
jgi:hypothetical protein